jgi:hypothetical protein
MSDPNVTGTMKGFRVISTESTNEHYSPIDPITLRNINSIIEGLRKRLNTSEIENLVEILNLHVARADNPHNVKATDIYDSVVGELYKVWLELGNRGTKQKFLSVLFNEVTLATLAEALEGTAENKIPSVADAAAVIEAHNTNIDAHTTLVNSIYGGTPPINPPDLSLNAEMGVDDICDYTRMSPQVYMDKDNLCKLADNHFIYSDYVFGQAMFYLGKDTTNEVKFNTALYVNRSVFINTGLTLVNNTTSKDIFGTTRSLDCMETAATAAHHISISNSLSKNSNYAGGIIIRPIGNKKRVLLEVTNGRGGISLNMETGKFDALSYDQPCLALPLPNGGYYLWSTFTTDATLSDSRLILRFANDFDQDLINIVYNSNFDSSYGWELGIGWTVDGTQLVADDAVTSVTVKGEDSDLIEGYKYIVSFDIIDYVSGALQLVAFDNDGRIVQVAVANANQNQTYRSTITCASKVRGIGIINVDIPFNGKVANFDIYQIPVSIYEGDVTKGINISYPQAYKGHDITPIILTDHLVGIRDASDFKCMDIVNTHTHNYSIRVKGIFPIKGSHTLMKLKDQDQNTVIAVNVVNNKLIVDKTDVDGGVLTLISDELITMVCDFIIVVKDTTISLYVKGQAPITLNYTTKSNRIKHLVLADRDNFAPNSYFEKVEIYPEAFTVENVAFVHNYEDLQYIVD